MPSSLRATKPVESSYDSLVPRNKSSTQLNLHPHQCYQVQSNYPTHTLWSCDECGDSGMTAAIIQCPQCQHQQCDFCEKYSKPGKEISHSTRPVICHNDEASALSRKSLAASKKSKVLITAPPVIGRFELSLDGVFNSDAISEIQSSSSASTPPPEPPLTPDSGSASTASSSPSSHQNCPENETEYGTEDIQDDADLSSDEDIAKPSDYWIWILESRLFSVLGHNLALAARLIPPIITQLQDESVASDAAYTAYPSSETTGTNESYENTSSISSTPDQCIPSNRSHQVKRGHGRDEDDHRDNQRPKRQRKTVRHQNTLRRPRFACHLHKSNPEKYCALAEEDFKFRVCLAPRATELRRLKQHYQNVHRPSQCDRCYSIFKDRGELIDHRKSEPPCNQKPDSHQEGINDSQWENIKPLFIVKRGSSDSEKQDHDIHNWFKIWKILFPDVSPPPHPWIDSSQIHPVVPSNDIEYVVNTFKTVIELDIEQGILKPDIVRDQRCERALRLALQTYSAISGPIEGPSGGELEVNDPESRFAGSRSGPLTTLESLFGEETPPLSASDQSAEALVQQNENSVELSIRMGHANIFSPRTDTAIASPLALYSTHDSSCQMSNPSPLLFDQTNLNPQLLTIQVHPTTSSSTSSRDIPYLASASSYYTPDSNPQEKPDRLEILDDAGDEYLNASYLDSLQAGTMADTSVYFGFGDVELNSDSLQAGTVADTSAYLGFGDVELNSDSLTSLLEMETAQTDAMAPWEDSRGRNRGLQGPGGQKP